MPEGNENVLAYAAAEYRPLSGWAIACFVTGAFGLPAGFLFQIADKFFFGAPVSLALTLVSLIAPFLLNGITGMMAIIQLRRPYPRRRGSNWVVAGFILAASWLAFLYFF